MKSTGRDGTKLEPNQKQLKLKKPFKTLIMSMELLLLHNARQLAERTFVQRHKLKIFYHKNYVILYINF